MKQLMRADFYRLFRSAPLLIALLVMLVGDLYASSRVDVTTENMYDLPMLCTMSAFNSYAERTNMSLNGAKNFFIKRGQLESSDAEEVTEVFRDVMPYQFRWVLASTRGMLFLPALFTAFFLLMDRQRRNARNALYVGHSRSILYISRILFLFLVCFCVSLLGILLLAGIYAGAVFTRLPSLYVWSRLLLHALRDCALVAPALLLGLVLTNLFFCAAAIAAYSVFLRFIPLHPLTRFDLDIWAQGSGYVPTLLISLGILALCAVLGWVYYRSSRLD